MLKYVIARTQTTTNILISSQQYLRICTSGRTQLTTFNFPILSDIHLPQSIMGPKPISGAVSTLNQFVVHSKRFLKNIAGISVYEVTEFTSKNGECIKRLESLVTLEMEARYQTELATFTTHFEAKHKEKPIALIT